MQRHENYRETTDVLYVKPYNYCCIPIPKCAGSSLNAAICEQNNLKITKPSQSWGFAPRAFKVTEPDTFRYDETFTFALVRHPFLRIHSLWRNKCFDWPKNLCYWQHTGLFRPEMPLHAFIAAILTIKDEDCDRHFRPVSSILDSSLRKIDINPACVKTFQLERIEIHWPKIAQQTRLGKLPLINKTKYPREPQQHWEQLNSKFSGMMMDFINRYKEDYDRYGYTVADFPL